SAGMKRVPPITAHLRHRRKRRAILHRDPFATGADLHQRADEMFTGYITHPRILCVVEVDCHPRMLLVVRVRRVESGYAAKVLDADILNAPRPFVSSQSRAAKTRIERGGERRIE